MATATLFGFAIEYPSAQIFLLPFAVLIPLSYKIWDQQNSILFVGTYISVVIEAKTEDLNWETFLMEKRKVDSGQKRRLRQLPNYLIFDLLAVLCLLSSFWYVTSLGNDVFDVFLKIDTATVLPFMIENSGLFILWFFAVCYFVWWTIKMRDCFGTKYQSNFETIITDVLNRKESND